MQGVVEKSLKNGVGAELGPRTISVAESCTGGRLAAALTADAGASKYFLGGVVAYSNNVKINALGVSPDTLAKYGAVSRQTAEEMACGVRRLTDSDISLATTGIAGPGGGSADKPVGTVWIARADQEKTIARCYNFAGTRADIMEQAVRSALELILQPAVHPAERHGAESR